MIKNIVLGADPEVFLYDYNTSQDVSPLFIPGTKQDPWELENGYYIQRDNMCAEFCIPPAKNPIDFVRNIDRGLHLVNTNIYQTINYDGIKLSNKQGVTFNKEDIDNDFIAQEFGCDPDYNVYTNAKNPHPECSNPYYRCAGGQ
jgi:hypothetical protein